MQRTKDIHINSSFALIKEKCQIVDLLEFNCQFIDIYYCSYNNSLDLNGKLE